MNSAIIAGWIVYGLGYAYFAWLAIRRFLDGPTRGRASIIAYAVGGMAIATSAVLLRLDVIAMNDTVIAARTMGAAGALWWMIAEFRGGRIVTRDACEVQWDGVSERRGDAPGRRVTDR